MAPLELPHPGINVLRPRHHGEFGDWRNTTDKEALIVEGWGEGFMVGALLIMALITIASMRKGVLLHKLILLELLLAMSHGTFCFMGWEGYGWYLSSTAALLYCSYFTHNVVAWLKIRPFFRDPQVVFRPVTCKIVKWTFLITLGMTAPVFVFEIFNNFRYFNNLNTLYIKVRPYEPLFRDPWWIYSCLTLFHVIRKCYGVHVCRLVAKSPRFGILITSILVAIAFTICDIVASVEPNLSKTDGINPYWKLALVFRCLTDNIMLDDFKSVLQAVGAMKPDSECQIISDPKGMALGSPKRADAGYDSDDYHDAISPQRAPSDEHDAWGRTSISGRTLQGGETAERDGYSRRQQSIAASGVGKFGRKITKLGDIGAIRRSAEEEAIKNMRMQQKAPGRNDSTRSETTMVPTSSYRNVGYQDEDYRSQDYRIQDYRSQDYLNQEYQRQENRNQEYQNHDYRTQGYQSQEEGKGGMSFITSAL